MMRPKRSFQAGSAPGKGKARASKTPRAMARASTSAAATAISFSAMASATGRSAGSGGEDDVAVERRVGRPQRPREAVMRGGRDALGGALVSSASVATSAMVVLCARPALQAWLERIPGSA